MAAQAAGVSATLSSFVSSANLLPFFQVIDEYIEIDVFKLQMNFKSNVLQYLFWTNILDIKKFKSLNIHILKFNN